MPRTIVQNKKDTRTKGQKQKEFLTKLSDLVSVSATAKSIGIGRQTVYDWLNNDPKFKIKYEAVIEQASQKLEDEAVRRAFEGISKPVYQGGKKVGTIKEYSDTLLIVLLKARLPEKYKDRTEQKIDLGSDATVVIGGKPLNKE